jgi:hypothetical protein
MNEHHQVRLLSTFQHVDNLLTESERIIASDDPASSLRQYLHDATSTQRRVMQDDVLRIRESMRRILQELQIPVNSPASSALWAARGRLVFACIALAEIEPEHMRGHGPLTEEDVKALERIGAELDAELRRMVENLAQ